EGTFGAWRIEESWALFAWTTIGQYPGVSGNGTLATVEFEVEAVGESILKFEFGDPALTYLIGQQEVHPPPHFYDIEFSVDGGYFSNIILAIYTDKYTYTSGEPMDLGLQLNNPMPYPITVCVAVWLERPTGPIVVILHAHAIMLPGDFRYSNPSFQSFILPALPPGIYTWHAALLNPSTHAILIEDTAVWEFV
ncbi:MAG: hypothetical protein JSV58_01980, partial [Candidatus Bathyarchaeota archaeon]